MEGHLMRLGYSIVLCVFLIAGTLLGQTNPEHKGRGKLWWSSVAAVVGASFVDAHSSWGRQELNPALQSANGQFGAKGVAIKAAIAGGAVFAQWLLLRRNPDAEKHAAVVNFGMATLFAGAAIRNHGNGGGATFPAPVQAPRPEYLAANPQSMSLRPAASH